MKLFWCVYHARVISEADVEIEDGWPPICKEHVRPVSEVRAPQYDRRIAALEAENARMRAVVEAVAEAGVGDEYGGGGWLMFAGYDAETVRQQARAILASDGNDTPPRVGEE